MAMSCVSGQSDYVEQPSIRVSVDGQSFQVTPSNCKSICSLGFGSFGFVKCVQHKLTRIKMAVKKINLFKYNYDDNVNAKYIRSEVDMLKRLSGQCRGIV